MLCESNINKYQVPTLGGEGKLYEGARMELLHKFSGQNKVNIRTISYFFRHLEKKHFSVGNHNLSVTIILSSYLHNREIKQTKNILRINENISNRNLS